MGFLLLLATLVTITPRLGIAPLPIAIRASIQTNSPEWYCPSIEVTWTDGTRSARESDCDPYEDLPDKYHWVERFDKTLGGGHHLIEVRLKQGKKEEYYKLEIDVLD